MPKRLVDGDALWRSNKLNEVQPLNFRAEYANLIPLAEADGTFEADSRRVWADVYSFNRPDVKVEQVEDILQAFEKAGMLVRKVDEKGKIWGMFVGIEARLPAKSQRERYKQGKGSSFSQMKDIQTDSRPNLDGVKKGLVRLGVGLASNRLGLEDRELTKEELAEQFAIDAAKSLAAKEKILAQKREEAEFAERTRGQF